MNYLYAALGAIAYSIALFMVGHHYGALAPELAQAKTEVKQEAAQDTKRAKDETTVAQEAKTYEAATDPALAPVTAPVVRLCKYTIVSSPNPAGSGADAKLPVRAPDPQPSVPGPDIGRPLVQIGHNADAQVAGLQDYIARVCQAKAP